MANKVYSVEEIELQDGTVVELKPLTIKRLRKFMQKMEEWSKAEDQYGAMDTLVQAGMICLEAELPEISKDQEKFEDAVDMDTLYKVVEVCGGVKLNDPEALAAAAAAAMKLTGNGTKD